MGSFIGLGDPNTLKTTASIIARALRMLRGNSTWSKRKEMLKINDKVEFELSTRGSKNRPRWEHNVDDGGTGKWATGFVKQIDAYKIVVHYLMDGHIGTGVCEWPNLLSPDYTPDQWKRPGYLRIKPIPKCECGGAKAKTTHSLWCPINTIGRK